MNLTHRLVALVVAASALTISAHAQQASQTVSAHWQGSMKVPGQPDLQVSVDLAKDPKGAWIGSFSMPEIGATDIPLEQLTVSQSKVHFLVGVPTNPTFDGSLSADGKELQGTFTAPPNKTPLMLKRMGAAKVKPPVPNSPLAKDFEGTWHATLDPQSTQIRMLLKLSRAPDGTAIGKVVNVDQGNREIPLTSIQQKDKGLEFEIRSVAVRFRGTIGADGRLPGIWSQLTNTAPLTFERGGFPVNSPLTKSLEGTWQATLDAGENYKIVLALKLARAADGTATGTLRNASEAGKELPVTSITLKNKAVEFTVQGLSAGFTGTLNEAGTEFGGTWVQLGTPMPLTFKRSPPEKKP